MVSDKPKIVCVIPARLKSTRLENKPLVDIGGKPLIRHTYENIAKFKSIDKVIIAADDERVINAVHDFGGEAVLTPVELTSGSDRVAHVCREIDADIIVNVQCDEPFLKEAMINTGLAPFLAGAQVGMGSLKTRLDSVDALFDPNVVKVVTDNDDMALYFSRAPIPYNRDNFNSASASDNADFDMLKNIYYKHLGIYFYTPDFLRKFTKMPPSGLETAERLEQLRALENGHKIAVPTTQFDSIGIDTDEDLEEAREYYRKHGRSD